MAIDAIVPAVIPVVVGNTKRLCVLSVYTVDVVNPTTESQSATSVCDLLCIEPCLVQINVTVVRIEQRVAGAVVTNAGPTANGEAEDVVLEQRPRFVAASAQSVTR